MAFRREKALIKDVKVDRFYDIVGEVVKWYAEDPHSACPRWMDLYITDYTTNTDLYLYEDPDDAVNPEYATQKNFPGPFGQMAMQVRLHHPHAGWAVSNRIREGDIVVLINVHAKNSPENKLEGAIHQDRRYPDKVTITRVTNPKQLEDHNQRKEAYWNEHKSRKTNPNAAQEDEANGLSSLRSEGKQALQKKAERKKKRRLQKEQKRREEEKKEEERIVARTKSHPHIISSHPDTALSTVSDVLNNPKLDYKDSTNGLTIHLPFVNCKYKSHVRVVDYSPKQLEDYARVTSSSRNSWEWAFCLLLEDAKPAAGTTPERLRVVLTNETGECLLNMDACNLRENASTAEKLREKLFILWGNLMELKNNPPDGVQFPLPSGDSRLQNMPFDACIEEYGTQVAESPRNPTGWQRTHRLFGTIIRS
ncbi:hypothetical protein BDV95DRAFT_489484 [Massariosphaeria phaeospora]|uniref:Protection of telomeres protein 1 ssDNA-binding domain-containing protein n=1 Tax=Massariosphaeria phaeospora TaxID=100035 RepID=A0A7C8I8V5_9PLEO|nr:hypothetical protein BDV95DRAFT_489484 [Massariosphaeria phaeospora]